MNNPTLAELITPRLPERDPIVITTGPLLGLGDHGVYSTLARRFKALGRRVFLDVDSQASNPEIYDLFWQRNPYINGLSDLKPNAGYVRQGLFYEWANRLRGVRSIEAMERAHGLPPPYSIAPDIYYEPKAPVIDVKDTVLVDYSAVSSKLQDARILEAIRMARGRYRNPPLLQILHAPWVALNQTRILESAYGVTSITEYCDLLAACRAVICSEAGAQTLASAMRAKNLDKAIIPEDERAMFSALQYMTTPELLTNVRDFLDCYEDAARPDILVTSTRQTFNSRGYTYRNSDYRATANDGQNDYWDPIEVKVWQYEVTCAARRVRVEGRMAVAGGA